MSVSIPAPRSAIGMGMPVPPAMSQHHKSNSGGMRARGFSAPGSFTPLNQGGAAGWGGSYPGRSALPPLTVPSEPSHLSHAIYHQQTQQHPITPTEESPTSPAYPYSREMMASSSQYPYSDQQNWQFSQPTNGASSNHSGSLSSLLNPSSSAYASRPAPTISTTYSNSPFAAMAMHNHSASSLSPDSRPTTGYSMSSVSSLPYEDSHLGHQDYGSRPNSSHHRMHSPSRPSSSKSSYQHPSSLSVRRNRRHSQALSPYPHPYEHAQQHHHQRPSSSPNPNEEHHAGVSRVRSMIQLPTVDPYSFNPGHAEFAYSVGPGAVPTATVEMENGWHHPPAPGSRGGRPSTSTSSISAASHSSQTNTPDHYTGGDTDINRCEYLIFCFPTPRFKNLFHCVSFTIFIFKFFRSHRSLTARFTDQFTTSLARLWVRTDERARSAVRQDCWGNVTTLLALLLCLGWLI